MIDQQLIQNNIEHASNSLRNIKPSGIDGLFFVDDFFTQELVDKLLLYLNSERPQWQQKTQPHRQEVNWESESVVEEAHEIFLAQTKQINQIFPDLDLKFLGLNIWKDTAGYRIRPHTDNPVILAALQIYLTTNPDIDLGTEFIKDQLRVNVPGKINCGYLANNSAPILHKTTNTVPTGHVRYCLYAIWSQA